MKINKAKNEKGYRFTFEGKHTQSEQIVRGEVVAANEDEAKKKLLRRGIKPSRVA